VWQNRRYEELRDPAHPGRAFTPNEKYAALVEASRCRCSTRSTSQTRGGDAPGGDGRHRHLTTLEGWRAFLGHDPGPPELLPAAARKRMPEDDRVAYDEQAHGAYHARLGVIQTPMLAEVLQAGRLLTLLNREAVSARRGLIVSGPAAWEIQCGVE
jgi:hypothetical protein